MLNFNQLKNQLQRLLKLTDLELQLPQKLNEDEFHQWFDLALSILEGQQPSDNNEPSEIDSRMPLGAMSEENMPATLSNAQRGQRRRFIGRMFQLHRSGIPTKTLANSLKAADRQRSYNLSQLSNLKPAPKPKAKPAKPGKLRKLLEQHAGVGRKAFGPGSH